MRHTMKTTDTMEDSAFVAICRGVEHIKLRAPARLWGISEDVFLSVLIENRRIYAEFGALDVFYIASPRSFIPLK